MCVWVCVAVEWSCLKDFSLLAGEMVVDSLQSHRCAISNLTTVSTDDFILSLQPAYSSPWAATIFTVCVFQGRLYHVRVSAYNMKGWGPPQCSLPPCASPSSKLLLLSSLHQRSPSWSSTTRPGQARPGQGRAG